MKPNNLAIIVLMALLSINATAQVKLPKNAAGLNKALNSGKITGKISYPKSAGAVTDFINKAKSKLTAWSFEIVSGQVTNKKTIQVSKVTITDITGPGSANYEFELVIEAVFPFDKPIDVVIDNWCYTNCSGLGGDHLMIRKVKAGEYAMLSSADKLYEGMNFIGTPEHIVY